MNYKEKFNKFYNKFKKNIPKQYNQLNMLEHLTNDELTYFFEISSRSDGKTTTFFSFFLEASIKFGDKLNVLYLTRHYELNHSIKMTISEIMADFKQFDPLLLFFENNKNYIQIYYNSEPIGIICDLNNAYDLKNYSKIMKKNNVILFDEFITLPHLYESNESLKLKTIYETCDKNFYDESDDVIFKHPKIIYLGNPINFDYEEFATFDLYEQLEETEINSYSIKPPFLIEMLRNDRQNELKNQHTAYIQSDGSLSGEFNFNRFNLLSSRDILTLTQSSQVMSILIDDDYVLSFFNNDITPFFKIHRDTTVPVQYCIDKKNERSNIEYIQERFYVHTRERLFLNNYYKFANNFTKNYMYDHPELLNIFYEKLNRMVNTVDNTEQLEKERVKYNAYNKFYEKYELYS